MSKYVDLYADVFKVFDLQAWKDLNIPTFPFNFAGDAAGNDYIRVNVLSGGGGINLYSVSGIINIDIFVQQSRGPKNMANIADALDTFLVGKSKRNGQGITQFGSSNLQPIGIDRDNPTLYRAIYSIPFSHSVGA